MQHETISSHRIFETRPLLTALGAASIAIHEDIGISCGTRQNLAMCANKFGPTDAIVMGMGVEALISEEQYLHTSYEPDCEFEDGVSRR